MDITNRIRRLKEYEDKYKIYLDGLYCNLIETERERGFKKYEIVLNGEIHSTNGPDIENDLSLVFMIYNIKNEVLLETSRKYDKHNFFMFDVFSLHYNLDEMPSIIRIYPDKNYETKSSYLKNFGDIFAEEPKLTTRVVGITFNNRIKKIKNLSLDSNISLKRDPDNEYDENAILVINENQEILGFLTKELAFKLAPIMDRGNNFKVSIDKLPEKDVKSSFKITIWNK